MAEIVDFGLQQHKIKMDSRYFDNVLSVVVGDTGRRIEVQLLDTKGMVQNTTGLNLRLNALIAGKSTFTDATLVDAATGKYQLDLSNGMFLAPGDWEFQWQITDSSGKKLNSFAFTGNVGKNISEGGSQAINFYLNLEDLKAMQEDFLNGTIDSAALETNIAEKLTDLEEQYAPKLTEVTARLVQTNYEKANWADVFLKENGININDFDEETRLAFLEAQGIDINYVLGEGNVRPENTTFMTRSKNRFDNRKVIMDGFLNYNSGEIGTLAGYSTGEEYVPVKAGEPVTLHYVRVYVFYDPDKIAYEGINTGNNSSILTLVPARDGFVRMTTRTDLLDRAMIEYGDAPGPYEPFQSKLYRVLFSDEQREEVAEIAQKTSSDFAFGNTIEVIKNGDEYTLISEFDEENEITIRIGASDSPNGSFKLRETLINDTVIHQTGDDVTPIRTNIATVGANHGYTNIISVVMANHGKTEADLGSRWTDGTTEYTLLKINESVLIFGCPYTVDVDGVTQSARVEPVADLAHVSGATSTNDISVATIQSGTQLYPSIGKLSLKFTLDGNELKEDGKYQGSKFQIVESYEVLDYKSIIDYARTNIGRDYGESDVDGAVKVSNIFTYGKGLNCATNHGLKMLKKVTLGRSGLIQSGPMALENHTLRRWLPNVKSKSGINFSGGVNMNTYNTDLYFNPSDFTTAGIPPNHSVDWLNEPDGERKVGFSLGYITDKTNSKNEDRVANTNIAWDMRRTGKIYPVAIEGTFEAGEYLNFAGFRNYLHPEEAGEDIAVVRVQDAKDTYFYVDLGSKVTARSISEPVAVGKEIQLVQSLGLSKVNETVDSEGVVVSSSANNANGVIKFS